MQRPPLFESDSFIYWNNRFETYVKSKDLDLWHIIINGDSPSIFKNATTQALEVVPKTEYERFFCVKRLKNLAIVVNHTLSGFVRFNTIITSLKALDEDFSSKKYVRNFLRALHPKWREKVTAIEEAKYLSSLALDELIDNLKIHEVIMEKDFEIYKGKKERVKSIALKAKKESSDDETSISRSEDEGYAMAVKDFKKLYRRKGKFVRQPRDEKKSFRKKDKKKGKSDRKCFRCRYPNHLIDECPKPPRNKDQKAFVEGS
ncbi:zf-CCHC domain-containing protein [Tanacetum coccineum]